MSELVIQPHHVTPEVNVSSPITDVMQVLRTYTAASHRQLESAVDLRDSITSIGVFARLLGKLATNSQVPRNVLAYNLMLPLRMLL